MVINALVASMTFSVQPMVYMIPFPAQTVIDPVSFAIQAGVD